MNIMREFGLMLFSGGLTSYMGLKPIISGFPFAFTMLLIGVALAVYSTIKEVKTKWRRKYE